jgi:hypothetical protein
MAVITKPASKRLLNTATQGLKELFQDDKMTGSTLIQRLESPYQLEPPFKRFKCD